MQIETELRTSGSRLAVTFVIGLLATSALGLEIDLSVKKFIPGIEARPGDAGVHGVALSPDGSLVYAAHWTDTSSDPIAVFSTVDYSLVDTMSYGRCHGNVVVSADGRYVFAPSYYQNNVSRFDLAHGNVRSPLPAGQWPSAVGLSPDSSRLVVLAGMDGRGYDMNNDAARIYDVVGGNFASLDTVVLPDEPRGVTVAFSPDSEYAYVATERRKSANARVYELSLKGTYGVTRYLEIAGATCLSSVAANETALFVADAYQQKLWIADRATLAVTDAIQFTDEPQEVAIHPDGQHLFVLFGRYSGMLSVYDISTKNLVDSLADLTCWPTDIEFGEEGRVAYVAQYYPLTGSSDIGGIAVLNVPEPATLFVLALGGLGLLHRRRRNQR